jgi:preprotein translocase subunit YajC
MDYYQLMTLLMTSPQGEEGGGGYGFFIFLGLFFVIIYFFMIRPQTKKQKDQKNFIANLSKGDRVVTIGGIHGKILTVHDDSYLVEIDSNTKIKIDRSAVSLEFTRVLHEKSGNAKDKDKK